MKKREIWQQRVGGPWYAFRYVGGKWRRRSTECKKPGPARKVAEDWKTEGDRIISGIIREADRAAAEPITKHLDAYIRSMTSRPRPAAHAQRVRLTIERYIIACRWVRLNDINEATLLDALNGLTVGKNLKRAATARTRNWHLSIVHSFVRWCIRTGRLRDDPFHSTNQFQGDAAIERRKIDAEALRRLIDAASRRQITRVGNTDRLPPISCADRAALYRAALATGFRQNELRSLRKGDWHFAPESKVLHPGAGAWAWVHLSAEFSKDGKDHDQPVLPEFVPELRKWLATKPDGDQPLWRFGSTFIATFKADLAFARAAWIDEVGKAVDDDGKPCGDEVLKKRQAREKTDYLKFEDADGKRFDFHALRGQYITTLADSGMSPVRLKELARHADIKTTLKHYKRVELADTMNAVAGITMIADPQSGRGPSAGEDSGCEDGSVTSNVTSGDAKSDARQCAPLREQQKRRTA